MSASSRARSTARSVPRRPGSEPSQIGDQAPGAARPALRQPDGFEVFEQPDGVRQEVVVGADLLSGDGYDRAAHGAAWRERVQAGALEREAGTGSEVAPGRWRDVSGAGRGAARAANGAGDALDHSVQPRAQREDDGRAPRRRADPGVEGRRRDNKEEGRHAPDGGSEPRFRALPVVNA